MKHVPLKWWVPLETPQTIWNKPILHRFIRLLSDVISFMKTLSHHYADDTWTSNACHVHNSHRRDLKFSDIVPDTITIFTHNSKNDKNLITSGTVPFSRSSVTKSSWAIGAVAQKCNGSFASCTFEAQMELKLKEMLM